MVHRNKKKGRSLSLSEPATMNEFQKKPGRERIPSTLVLLLMLAIFLGAGCGSNGDDFVAAPGGTNPALTLPDSLEENLHTLSQEIGKSGLSTSARDARGRQINEVLNGPKGGTITLSGDLNFGADASNPVTSMLTAQISGYTFFDGLTLDGGNASVETVLWGSQEAAQGSVTMTAENVRFSGSGSGVHSFVVEFDLVNSQVVRTVLTLDGREQELGFVLNISNMSQNPADEVFVTIIGKDPADTKWHYMADPDAEQMTEFDDQPGSFLNKVNGVFEGAEKYSMTLSEATPVAPNTYRLIVPRENLVSGRIYFSFGQKLQGIGINAPYYNPEGQPITTATTATGALVSGSSEVTLSGIDATKVLGLNLPVSYQAGGQTVNTTVAAIISPTRINLSNPPTQTLSSVTLNFTPDPAAISGAKLNLSGPSPTGPPDYLTTFDLVELSATTNPNAEDPFYTLFANTTAIDFYSVGIGMTVNYSGLPGSGNTQGVVPSSRTVGFGTSAEEILAGVTPRDAILERFNNAGSPDPATPVEFQAFVTAKPVPNPPGPGNNSTGDPHLTFMNSVDKDLQIIRVLGPPPIVALLPNGDTSKYLQSTIDNEWVSICMSILGQMIFFPTQNNPSFIYQGTANSSEFLNLQCTLASPGNDGQGEVYQLPAPTTRIVWECDDTEVAGRLPLPNNYQNAGSDAHRRLASIISSAFARGVFAEGVSGWSDTSKFYTRADLRYNFFSKVMHDFALNGIVYGFAYDDVYGQDSTLAGPIGLTQNGKLPQSELGNVVDVTLTIPDFKAPPPPAKPGVPLTVQAVYDCEGSPPDNFAGCIAHLTPETGPDLNAPLDASGKAVISGLSANVTYTAWISPGQNWFISYAAQGEYDGTTDGTWNSSTGTNEAGVIKLKIGALVPGVGSCLDPQPANLTGAAPPLTSGSGQSSWGNVQP